MVIARQDMQRELDAMSKVSGIPADTLLGRSRLDYVCAARCILWWHLVRKCNLTTLEVGRTFGRNHSTILSGIRRAEMFRENASYYGESMLWDKFNAIIGL